MSQCSIVLSLLQRAPDLGFIDVAGIDAECDVLKNALVQQVDKLRDVPDEVAPLFKTMVDGYVS